MSVRVTDKALRELIDAGEQAGLPWRRYGRAYVNGEAGHVATTEGDRANGNGAYLVDAANHAPAAATELLALRGAVRRLAEARAREEGSAEFMAALADLLVLGGGVGAGVGEVVTG